MALLGRGRVVARYPSGNTISKDGELHFGRIPNSDATAPVVVAGDQIVVLDSPEWAKVEVFTSNAEGAWPAGTRIRKATFEDGDAHQIGDLGTVKGSLQEGSQLLYSIVWDDYPETPICTLSTKIEKILDPQAN